MEPMLNVEANTDQVDNIQIAHLILVARHQSE
jgi:hypothetical protein